MPNTALPNLDAAGALDGTELTYITQTGESRKLTLAQLATYIKTAESITPTNLPYRGAVASRTTDVTGITWPIIVSWQQALINTDSIWSLGDATKLVVPAGVTKIRLFASVDFESVGAAGSVLLTLRKNDTGTGSTGAIPTGRTTVRNVATTGFGNMQATATTPVMDVTPGDYFDVRANASQTGQDQIVIANSFFEMEIIEAVP